MLSITREPRKILCEGTSNLGSKSMKEIEEYMEHLPLNIELETIPILKALNKASRALAELKGEVRTIPNETILINTLTLQEAKESSAIENIITTQDDLFRAEVDPNFDNFNAKEVQHYSEALRYGFKMVTNQGGLSNNNIQEMQSILEPNKSGFRKMPGTTLKNLQGDIIYTPPQSAVEIDELMRNLESYINNDELQDLDPLIKMAIIHFQFESIHPFYDGNGRSGRIINILYMVLKGLMDIPVLYLSRYIIDNKAEYYNLIQAVRDENHYEDWIIWMLIGVEQTAKTTTKIVQNINLLMLNCKADIQRKTKIYSKELLDALFVHPYTKISFIAEALNIHRNTATSQLNTLVEIGVLDKIKLGRSNYYVNNTLYSLLSSES